jgi:FdhD protein
MSTELPRLHSQIEFPTEAASAVSASRDCSVVRVAPGGGWSSAADRTAVEEPLQVCLDGAPFAVIMRTPGDDADLVAGFLLSESVIGSWTDVSALGPALDPHGQPRHNVIDVHRTPEACAHRGLVARGVTTSAACGLCGRQQIESLRVHTAPVPMRWRVEAEVLHALSATVRARQQGFEATGGLHAAALFDSAGALLAVAEDVGRHNAVDKVIGRRMRAGALPLADLGLFVSGRVAFEIVQKAALAGLGLIVAVSAPSSLAVELATASGITLVGFARDRRFNVYAHPERVVLGDPQP